MRKGPYVNDNTGIAYMKNAAGVVIGGPWLTNRILAESGTFVSVKTPGFKNLKRSQLPWNPFSQTFLSERRTEGFITNTTANQYTVGFCYGNIGGSSWKLFEVSSAEVSAIAKSKLLNELSNSSVNLAQSFAERTQTANLLGTSVNRLATLALAIKRGNFSHAVKLIETTASGQELARLRRLARKFESSSDVRIYRRQVNPLGSNTRSVMDFFGNAWLEFSYGWRPLVNDIYGSCELLANTYNLKRPTVVSKKHEMTLSSLGYPCRIKNEPFGTKNIEMAYSASTRKVRYVVEYLEDSQALTLLAQTGMTNPALLAWELLPYSFVIDWAYPLGQYLKNLEATRGLVFQRGVRVETWNHSHTTKWVCDKKDVRDNWVSGCSRDLVSQGKTRTVLASFPSPSLPAWRLPTSNSQIASGLSLLNQLFRK